MKQKIVIYGTGLGGQTLRECIALYNKYEVAFFLDDDPPKVGSYVSGIIIRNGSDMTKLKKEGIFGIATEIANSKKRLEIKEKAKECGLELINVIHPSAYIASSVKLGKGNFIKAGAIIETNSIIGDCCIIDNGVIIPHDNIIEDGCHLAPGVTLGSSIRVGKHSIIGIGTSISTKIIIGKNVIVSVGSSVTRDIPDNSVVEGVPGKIIGKRK